MRSWCWISADKSCLISFSGIDGTGKTTLANGLVEILRKKGIKSRYTYGRLEPFIVRPFMKFGNLVFLRKKSMSQNYSNYMTSKNRIFQRYPILSWIYFHILWIDYYIQLFFKISIPLWLNRTVVCDRYIYDTVINDISVDMNHSEEKILELINHFFLKYPRPDFAFLIDIPEETAFQRKNDIPSILYLTDRRNRYLNIGKKFDMIVIDGSRNVDEILFFVQETISLFGDK